MKILCVSDHRDPIVYSSQIKSRFGHIDLVLAAGDLELEYYGFIVSSLNKPLLFVFGNHNLSRLPAYRKKLRDPFIGTAESGYLEPSFGSTHVGGKIRRVKGLIVAGLGGSRRYNDGLNQFSERAMFMRMMRLFPALLLNRIIHGRYLDILLTHTPPFGIGDLPDVCHQGFKVFLWFMRVFRPTYLIHGHIHLYDLNAKRESVYHQTRVVNAYDHTVIEIDIDAARP
jgi:uncharacterized protein